MEQQGPDRNALLGVLLISLILGAWLLFFTPRQAPTPVVDEAPEAAAETEAEIAAPDDAPQAPTDPAFAQALATMSLYSTAASTP